MLRAAGQPHLSGGLTWLSERARTLTRRAARCAPRPPRRRWRTPQEAQALLTPACALADRHRIGAPTWAAGREKSPPLLSRIEETR
ncbi:MAG TPA: hypothetical protein VN714_33020 [Trebonia sp.]|nr:hypothetical protein [Trebonia sp.]